MKYFLSSLGKLAETLDSTEKERVENLTIQFLSNHPYFSNVWKQLSIFQKNRILEIIVSGKGVIPYEKILTKDSLSIKPEDGIFFTKDEFFSTLKGKGVDNESYENSKQLFILLKMRNLSDLNDLYNAQDVILLLEMMENRFQTMQDTTGYNPRIINSASELSSCIQREQSKVIIALPTNNIQMEVFEKTLSGGYSCVNNRLSFDTEILMPNLRESDYKKMNLDQSFKAFKRDDLKVTVMGLYEIENLDNQNICTIAINPKEYIEKFKNRSINKKHKGVRRDTPGMFFESYAGRISKIKEFDSETKEKKIVQKRLQVKNTEMKMTSVKKVQFASLNDKRYYFSDGIVSLPFGHPSLSNIRDYKKSLPKIHTVIRQEKNKILKMENEIVNKNERLSVLCNILSQPITYFNLKSNVKTNIKDNDFTSTRDYILNSRWL